MAKREMNFNDKQSFVKWDSLKVRLIFDSLYDYLISFICLFSLSLFLHPPSLSISVSISIFFYFVCPFLMDFLFSSFSHTISVCFSLFLYLYISHTLIPPLLLAHTHTHSLSLSLQLSLSLSSMS